MRGKPFKAKERPPAPNIKIIIDWKKVDDLLEAGCTIVQIASHFRCTRETIYERFEKEKGLSLSTYAQQKRESGENILRAKQHELAKEGNIPMLIWLGKVRLGQSETQVISSIAPNQESIDKDHMIMQQKNEIAELKKKLEENGNKSQAG
jgi:AraC-like DNA-binding protein